MTKRARRSRRRPQSKRRIAYIVGGITTGVTAAATVVWRRLRPKHGNSTSADGDQAESDIYESNI